MTAPKRSRVHQTSLELGRRLRELRLKHKWTQEDAADQAGLSARYYKQIESKTPNSVTLETLSKLARAFETTPSKLIDFLKK